jgi:hypothetical protein
MKQAGWNEVADFTTTSLCSRSLTDVHAGLLFSVSKPRNIHRCLPMFAGIGLNVGVKSRYRIILDIQALLAG